MISLRFRDRHSRSVSRLVYAIPFRLTSPPFVSVSSHVPALRFRFSSCPRHSVASRIRAFRFRFGSKHLLAFPFLVDAIRAFPLLGHSGQFRFESTLSILRSSDSFIVCSNLFRFNAYPSRSRTDQLHFQSFHVASIPFRFSSKQRTSFACPLSRRGAFKPHCFL